MNPGFTRMREQLVERGLIVAGTYRLTEAGMAETDRMLQDLRSAPPPAEVTTWVYWNYRPYRERKR